MSSVGPTSVPSKVVNEGRKLACRLCQKRKKKCNRKSPCSMCIKVRRPPTLHLKDKTQQRADIFLLTYTYSAQSCLSAKHTSTYSQKEAVDKGPVCPVSMV